ncbi:MAG: DUF2075 domain-containing protein [Candidatus Peregrinibacteria bacterium]|nr:DUF2075 domain-containing protein [Candidatus Peregrinibacteria bacterium]
MAYIYTVPFQQDRFDLIKDYHFGRNWPVVYIIEDSREVYIGETTDVYTRSKQHFQNPERRKLARIHLISDEEYNKSATLDIESLLIQYMSAEGSYLLQNGNLGLQNHYYYDKQKYQAKFEIVWEELKKKLLVKKDLVQIRNSDLFKYSPYKALTNDQLWIANSLTAQIDVGDKNTFVVNGGPGTGKTILATYLVKLIQESSKKKISIGFVVPMTSLRKTIKKVFKGIKGLSSALVIGPNEVTSKKYDLLIVDEAHRLKRRKNITNYQSFDQTNRKLELGNEGTELDWILMSAPKQILFYDKNQTVRPSDIPHKKIDALNAMHYKLEAQLRVGQDGDGEKYIEYIQSLFDGVSKTAPLFSSYDFKVFDDIHEMTNLIKVREKEAGLSRLVSGYAWPWVSKNDPTKHDIEIDGLKLYWNSVNHDWVNSPNAINEVGCIHTVQGYDLNYAGVIIGPELSYDAGKGKFVVHTAKYMDINGRRGVDDPAELESYIINIYKTLLTRAIKGTYVYVVDTELRKYIMNQVV